MHSGTIFLSSSVHIFFSALCIVIVDRTTAAEQHSIPAEFLSVIRATELVKTLSLIYVCLYMPLLQGLYYRRQMKRERCARPQHKLKA